MSKWARGLSAYIYIYIYSHMSEWASGLSAYIYIYICMYSFLIPHEIINLYYFILYIKIVQELNVYNFFLFFEKRFQIICKNYIQIYIYILMMLENQQ